MSTVRASNLRGLLVGTLVLGTALFGYAADPPGGTVSETSPIVTWTGPVKPSVTVLGCAGPTDPACDHFRLSIIPPSPAFGPYVVEIRLQPSPVDDWDLTVFGPNGTPVGGSGGSPSQVEIVVLNNPPAGTYTVTGVPFAVTMGYTASATLKKQTLGGGTPGSDPVTYAHYVPPPPLGQPGQAEPSIGCNWKNNKVMYLGEFETLRITFDDCSSPPKSTWEDKTFITTGVVTLDPILFTDRVTGRTFVSQLSAKCSTMAFTDDDGDTWIQSQGCGINSGVDHQTVGGGPFAAPLTRDPNGPVYPHGVYYCSQDLVAAQCARSDTGGLTFGPAVPIYTFQECGGLHGQVKVSSSDGTVYIPNKGCQGQQAVVVSEDSGMTWQVRRVPGSTNGAWDPSVGIALDGTVYFGYGDGDGQPKVAKSTNRGLNWTSPQDVGLPFGIKHTSFPAIVAGDSNRAAFAFLGSSEPSPGGAGDDPNWPGDWFLYVAHTYDGGATWTTLNATPNDPVQRGTICSFGIGCNNGTRNLLDFMGATIDREGRVLVGYADGCIGDCVKTRPNSFTARSTIARQVNGRRMFASFDVVGVAAAPLVTATFDTCDPRPTAVVLSWSPPDDHGSVITAYKIYRRTETGTFSLLATVGANVTSYTDSTIDPNLNYFYRVTAVNGQGESPACGETSASCPGGGQPEDACIPPGKTILTDGTGDFTLPVGMPTIFGPALDIQKLSIAEPFDLGAGKIMFILKMVSLQNVPPETTWPILFRAPDGTDFSVRMHTNALGQVFFTVATGTNTSPVTNPGSPADPASGFSPDGTIRIVVARSAIGSPQVGQDLTMFLVRVRSPEGGAALTPDNMPDGLARTGIYTVVGSENCVCNAPNAVDDAANTDENTPVLIKVLANDSDGGSPPLSVASVTQPANGSVTNNDDGTVTYRPNSGFSGSDSFSYTARNRCGATDTATVNVTVNARRVDCLEDDHSQIQYENGWHLVSDPDASAGHFRLNAGKNNRPHGASLSFELRANKGSITYHFARSPKGGSAEIILDGVSQGTISYKGSTGTTRNPEFGCNDCSKTFAVFGLGTHTLEIRGISDAIYVDRFCVESGTVTSQPTSGPGTTTGSVNLLAPAQELVNSLSVPTGTLAISVMAEPGINAPIRLVLIDPSGSLLETAETTSGFAVIEKAVSQAGPYVIKVVNLGLGPVEVWTAATPLVAR